MMRTMWKYASELCHLDFTGGLLIASHSNPIGTIWTEWVIPMRLSQFFWSYHVLFPFSLYVMWFPSIWVGGNYRILNWPIKMSDDITENFPLIFKNNLIFDRIHALPHFIGLLLGYGKTKWVFGFVGATHRRHQLLNLRSFNQVKSIALLAYR
jgi:hypothetical protein